MATILKNIVQFVDLIVDETTSLPHLLNVNGIPVVPQLGGANAGGFEVTADETYVHVIRTAAAASGDVNVFVEFWHTIESVTPPGKLVGLTPFFFAAGGGGGGGAGLPVTDVLQGNADLTAGMTNLYTTNGITTPFVGTFPPADSVPNGTLLAVKHNGQPGDGMTSAQCITQGADDIDTDNSINIEFGAGSGILFVSDGGDNWWTVAFYPASVG